MQIWMTLALALQMLSALVMIGLVLIQHGKGADMGASFGSGASGSLFGASGSANFLSRSTAACATVFFVSTLALALMSDVGGRARESSGASVLDRPAEAASAPATGAIPAAIPAPAPASAAAAGAPADPAPAPAGAASAAAAIPK
ncbi:MAG: preprotein translocase subunit SecG [Rubrivivax sp. SCN 71-131]|jgi:preprotein translocase subunit SecG|nr:MAG: preprotein translocase subunit SecG [Rubrivivax sp. SCN 71-131]